MSIRSASSSRASMQSEHSLTSPRGSDVKSSGFHPVSMSPMARLAIVEHMNSHYRRVNKAKAVVDTSSPKSYQLRQSSSSVSSSRQSSRPNSRSSSRTNQSQYTQINREEVLQTTQKINYYLEALKREQKRLLDQVAAPKVLLRRTAASSKASVQSLRIALRPQRQDDIMEKHSEYFTSERAFTPRVLQSNTQPTLREYRWYNPSRRKTTKQTSSESLVEGDEKLHDCDDGEQPSDHLSEYYERWLEDQVQQTARSREKSHGTPRSRNRRSSSYESLCSENTQGSGKADRTTPNVPPSARITPKLRISTNARSYQDRKTPSKEDEDLKCLEFIVDITNDILARGIYTNKVLKQVFQSHLERRKHELTMEKMEEGLRQLKLDLGIPDDDSENAVANGFGYGQMHRKPGEPVQHSMSKSSDRNMANGFPSQEIALASGMEHGLLVRTDSRTVANDSGVKHESGVKLTAHSSKAKVDFSETNGEGGIPVPRKPSSVSNGALGRTESDDKNSDLGDQMFDGNVEKYLNEEGRNDRGSFSENNYQDDFFATDTF